MTSYPETGSKVPSFEMTLNDGSMVSDKSLLGSRYVLYFYPKDDTSGCTLEAQGFTALIGEFNKKSCSVIGVSKDDTKSHCKFIDKYGLAVKLATDNGSVSDSFGAWQEKSMYGKKYMGIARTTFLVGKDGTIEKVWTNVKPEGHPTEVLSAL